MLTQRLSLFVLAQAVTFSAFHILGTRPLESQEPVTSRPGQHAPIQLAANRRDSNDRLQTMRSEREEQEIESGADSSIELFHTLLRESRQQMADTERYTATLVKQERVDGVLQDEETIKIKVRHEPFSVYMKWPDEGKEALYVEGQHDNKLLARVNKGLAALKGVWQLDPESSKAMKGCRYPITEAGLQSMIERVHRFYTEENTSSNMTCEHRNDVHEDRPVIVFEINFPSEQESPYSRCQYLFDAETKLLFGIELCEWDHQGKPAGIAEKYIFTNIKQKNCAGDNEFESDYPEYSLALKK